jgi:hypothetical protein
MSSIKSNDEFDMNGSISLTLVGKFDLPAILLVDVELDTAVLKDENSNSYNGLSLVPIIVK